MRARQANRRTPHHLLTLAWTLMLLPGAAACAALPVTPSPVEQMRETPVPLPTQAQPPMPSPSMTDCLAIPGRIETGTVPTARLPKPIQINVYLPPCYDGHAGLRYPVLYLFHGAAATPDQWIRLGATATADRLIAAQGIPPFLIVMPYDPSVQEPDQYGFADAITEDLVPYIDSRYRTRPDREGRAVGGLSRGSGWALHLGLTRPDLFGAIGAHSVVLFGADAQLVDNWLAAIPAGLMPRLYMDIGEYDGGLSSARILEDMLTAADVPHEWHLNAGSHDETYWSRHIASYLRWYAAGW